MKNKDSQILQQNRILLGGQTINLRARQLIYALAASMDKNNPGEYIRVPVSDFLAFINSTSGERWTDVYSITNDVFDHLNKNPILIKEPRKKDFKKINWLSSLGVSKGIIEARFSADIAEYFLYKQGLPYTKLLWDLRPYNSNFTARIMDLFQRYHQKQSGITEFNFKYEYQELRLFFGVHEKYPRFADFKKRVLETARKELYENDIVPYWFDYEEIRQGKSVAELAFTVYVRPEVLLKLVPKLNTFKKSKENQANLFESAKENELSKTKKNVVNRLQQIGVNKNYALTVVANLSNSQSVAYFHLVEYGVNRSLAFTIVRDYCAFGELMGNEHLYVEHTLKKIEAERKKRIAEVQKGNTKKRATPDHKKGGLAKNVFVEKQHFPSFMEKLSHLKKEESNYTSSREKTGLSSLGDIIQSYSKKKEKIEN